MQFLLRRALFALLLVFVVSSSAFILTRLAPGDAAQTELGQRRDDQAEIRRQLGLDRSLSEQYADWLTKALRLDFGTSIVFSRPVNTLLFDRARNTAVLAVVALALATLIGIPLGIYTGTHTVGLVPTLARAVSLVVLSVPPLLASLVLLLIAARTGWLPIGGMTSPSSSTGSWSTWLTDIARHVPLPALALALPIGATLERLQAQAIADAVREPFVGAALARGTTAQRAVWRHAWPVSLGPVLSLYGVVIGTLFSGSFVVEVITGWPGLGRLMYDALRGRDLYLVAGCAAAGALFIALGTFTSDVLMAVIDPRRRLMEER